MFPVSAGVSVFNKVTWQVFKIYTWWRSSEQSCNCFFVWASAALTARGSRCPRKHWFSLFVPRPVRCLSLAPHLRPSPSAPDCWNTHRWRGCLHWRHARTLSSTSCASPTPACPAAENCHSSSTSVPLVSWAPSLRSSHCRLIDGDVHWSLALFQSCLFSLSWTPHSFLLTLVRRHRLPHMVGITTCTWRWWLCYLCAFSCECTNECLCFFHHRGQCARQFRPVQLSTWIYQQQRLSTHPSVIFSFFFSFFLSSPFSSLPLSLPPGSNPIITNTQNTQIQTIPASLKFQGHCVGTAWS